MSIYLGPYVACEGKAVVAVTVKKNACNNEKCSKYKVEKNSNFCPECGTAIIKIDFIEEYKKDAVYELLEERLVNREIDGKDNYFANIGFTGVPFSDRKHIFHEFYKQSIFNVTSEIIDEEINKFTSFFDKEIEILRKEYKKIEVKFGLLIRSPF